MPDAAFFQRLGVFVLKDFLGVESCRAIASEMQMPHSLKPAKISRDGSDRVDEDIRSTKLVTVSKATTSLLEQHLALVKPKLEEHFSVELDNSEEPHFLAYKEGDFFKPHTDSSTSYNAHGYIQQRRVSVVLFVNGEASSSAQYNYTGGSLILYGLIKQPCWENYGFNIQGEPGLLIAFASDIYHEVTPVLEGMRFTMVTWFPAKEQVLASALSLN
jgi:predicted 2-oxoglutarate/Fe(II)-dependent dioxygenase YbiX